MLACVGRRRCGGRREGCDSFALGERKVVALDLGGRTAAGLLLLIDHFVQAAVLEHDALAGLHAIDAAIEDAGDEDVGRVRAGVVDTGVATLAQTDLDVRRARGRR